jgi:hypothetical protein
MPHQQLHPDFDGKGAHEAPFSAGADPEMTDVFRRSVPILCDPCGQSALIAQDLAATPAAPNAFKILINS